MPWTVMAKTHFQDNFLPCCFVILIVLQPLPSIICANGKADFYVIGPKEPLLVVMGNYTELPCHLNPIISVEDMELRWYRDRPSPAVYVYEKGKDASKEQMEEYQGRIAFVGEDVAKGKAAVRIYNVTSFDNGTYHCRFKDGKVSSKATLWLKVAGLGETPRIRMRGHNDSTVQAECSSAGWYPEPQVEWTDFKGNTIPSETNVIASATSGLFAVASNMTVSDKTVEGLCCSVSNPLLPERKVAKIYLPESFSRRSPSTVWRIVLPLILVVLGLVIAGAICVFWKRQQEKSRRLLEEERGRRSTWDQASHGWRTPNPIYKDVAGPFFIP